MTAPYRQHRASATTLSSNANLEITQLAFLNGQINRSLD